MRFIRVTAFIFMVIAATAVGWQLGKPAEDPMENQASDRPPTEQHIKDKIREPRELEGQDHADHATSQEEIETRYTVQLMNTTQDYEDRLIDMAKTAWEEYPTTQKEGKSISRLAFTYFRKVQQLESECDEEIDAILQEFESELQANSLPVDKVKLYKQEYEQRKSELKETALNALSQYKNSVEASS
ncbi:MAG TPA: hypothetical protein DDY25_05430 [Peptococcaceae bacterium]|nr:hypothetical protein [Syntrophaceticus sp.]MDD4360192.1 hypothetical protein [Syntrophaceticus sp.]HBI27150.1 hypothetical protein [Peptococcaceae bacterium]